MADRRAPSASRSGRDPRDRSARRVLLASLAASALLHLVVAVADPPLRLPGPGIDVAADRLELVAAPPEPQPPTLEIPMAAEPIPPPAEPVLAEADPADGGDAEDSPRFVAHDVPPRLINASDVQQYLQAYYPPELRAAGVAGRVRLLLYVDERGNVTQMQLRDSSGSHAFDELAQSAAQLMRFRPAISGDQTVGVWVAQPLQFRTVAPGTAGELASR